MLNIKSSQSHSQPQSKSHSAAGRWNAHDTKWTLSLFGTAVGAGILFLPINIGAGGFWPLIIMALLAGPMTFLAHRGLSRFVLSSKKPEADFTDVVEEHFGPNAGRIISILYFLSIYPILLIYGVGLTNTIDSFIVNQLGLVSPSRVLLSGILVAGMVGVMMGGEKLVLKAFEIIVYPLVLILAGLSIYMIQDWQVPDISMATDMGEFSRTLWLAVPVTVFAFSHAAAISSFSTAQKRHYGQQAGEKSEQILKRTSIMLISFVIFFVFSCVFSLTPEQLLEAKVQNISVLSYLANVKDNALIASLGPLIAFIAITSSFFGHFLGAREGLNGLIRKQVNMTPAAINKLTIFLLFTSIWAVSVMNPSILNMMEMFSGPVIAMILFVMPMYAVSKVEALAKYRGALSNIFVTIMGLIAISALIFNVFL
ncbi:HAAAP family serine/threonine permease [Moritella sp.]|uniref:HAAAP family serine/threonine permease n=1 Tax=Moritella sp. TaxID=78556 RepID=UPI001E01A094|nr:HAAAP family serine/threonine permease [Moritella sp.]MCJ8348869.1 HAAAP family serine/threonine permease [Moritella sp.]NQZ38742.1 HAAAP family serine/threonine permease [Moritella sp.]